MCADTSEKQYIADLKLDSHSIQALNPDIVQEQKSAIFDLLQENYFAPLGLAQGPYGLFLSLVDNRLMLSIRKNDCEGEELSVHILSLTPFRRIIRDYFLICESYYSAIRNLSPSQIEAIDMGRRGLHNEGGEIFQERLKDKIEMDFDTARRCFTLLCALHWKG